MTDTTDPFDVRPGNGFGLIRTNTTTDGLEHARGALDHLYMKLLSLSISHFQVQLEPTVDRSGEVVFCRQRISRDEYVEHSINETADHRPETSRRISVRSEHPERGIHLTIHMARETCHRYAPTDRRESTSTMQAVDLAYKAVNEAIMQAKDDVPEALTARMVQGAAMFRDPDVAERGDGIHIMATGMSRLTPGMIRSGPITGMDNVRGACLSTPSLPAWTRFDTVFNDGSDGSRPEISIELAELRIRTRIDDLSIADKMRAIAEWEVRRTETCRMMTPRI